MELFNKEYFWIVENCFVKNFPYLDRQHNGKVPKFLTHRLFLKARSYVTGTKRILFLDWLLIFRLRSPFVKGAVVLHSSMFFSCGFLKGCV
jgi:hypothetical protein